MGGSLFCVVSLDWYICVGNIGCGLVPGCTYSGHFIVSGTEHKYIIGWSSGDGDDGSAVGVTRFLVLIVEVVPLTSWGVDLL